MTSGRDVNSALNGCGEDGGGGARCGDPSAAETAGGGRGLGAEWTAAIGTFGDCFWRAVDAGAAGRCGTGAPANDDADRTRAGSRETGAEECQRRGSADSSFIGHDEGSKADAGGARAAVGGAGATDRKTAGEGAKDSAGCSKDSRRSDSVLVRCRGMRSNGELLVGGGVGAQGKKERDMREERRHTLQRARDEVCRFIELEKYVPAQGMRVTTGSHQWGIVLQLRNDLVSPLCLAFPKFPIQQGASR